MRKNAEEEMEIDNDSNINDDHVETTLKSDNSKMKPMFCHNCSSQCKISIQLSAQYISDIATLKEINCELGRHGHPRSRVMQKRIKRARNTAEAKNELLEHLKFAHNL